ncbi:MAG: hypothetical protein J6Y71_06670 [Ruminococcus sp.]|nr:hypothetical protein [Ruminococcus sp.]
MASVRPILPLISLYATFREYPSIYLFSDLVAVFPAFTSIGAISPSFSIRNSSTELSDASETVDDLLKIQSLFGETFNKINVKQEKINKYLKGLHFSITK